MVPLIAKFPSRTYLPGRWKKKLLGPSFFACQIRVVFEGQNGLKGKLANLSIWLTRSGTHSFFVVKPKDINHLWVAYYPCPSTGSKLWHLFITPITFSVSPKAGFFKNFFFEPQLVWIKPYATTFIMWSEKPKKPANGKEVAWEMDNAGIVWAFWDQSRSQPFHRKKIVGRSIFSAFDL